MNEISLKHKIEKRIVYMLFPILLFSCGEKENVGSDSISLSLKDEIGNEIRFSDLFEVSDVICLETTDESLLARVSKVVSYKNEYYLLDRSQKRLYVFDGNGHYMRCIGAVGDGPGEYVHLSDFTIDEENGRVAILDAPSNIYLYDLQGNFLESKRLDKSMFRSIMSNKDGFVCTTNYSTYTEGDNAYLIYRFDKNFNLMGKGIEALPLQMAFPSFVPAILQECDEKTYYIDSYLNKIYCVGDSVSTPYQIAFELPISYRIYSDTQGFMQNYQKYDFLMAAFITPRAIALAYIHDKRYFVAKFDREGKSLVNTWYKGRFPTLYPSPDGTLCMYMNAPDYLSYWKNYVSLSPDIRLTEEDNGLILKCRLK